MMNDSIERELKLRPLDSALLDRLAAVDRLGPFSVAGHRHQLQRNSFFDSAVHAFSQARLGFRRRTIQAQPLATWTLKGGGSQVRGVSSRTEVELQLEAGMSPTLAIEAVRRMARQRGAAVLTDELGEALARGGPPLATPFLETDTDRTILDLELPEHGWSVELALDRVQLVGHAYAEQEIEAELKRGDEAALEVVREAITALGATEASEGSKLSRASAHLDTCQGCAG